MPTDGKNNAVPSINGLKMLSNANGRIEYDAMARDGPSLNDLVEDTAKTTSVRDSAETKRSIASRGERERGVAGPQTARIKLKSHAKDSFRGKATSLIKGGTLVDRSRAINGRMHKSRDHEHCFLNRHLKRSKNTVVTTMETKSATIMEKAPMPSGEGPGTTLTRPLTQLGITAQLNAKGAKDATVERELKHFEFLLIWKLSAPNPRTIPVATAITRLYCTMFPWEKYIKR